MARPAPHDRAQVYSSQAALAAAGDKTKTAIRLYAKAAALEMEAFEAIDTSKPRTRGIIGVSVAALLLKSEQFDAAAQFIHLHLAAQQLPRFALSELREMLEAVWDEQRLRAVGYRYSGEEILVALRGGRIGAGTAPVDTAVHHMGALQNLVFRTTEFVAGRNFRRRGLPQPDVRDLLLSRATQPARGSYRFSLKLVEPAQSQLFPHRSHINATKVASTVLSILRAVASGDAERLGHVIQEPSYRVALMKLARNVLPVAGSSKEIEVRRAGEPALGAVLLHPDLRADLTQAIKAAEPSPPGQDRELRGTLRALDLDKRWLAIDEKNGSRHTVRIKPEAALDDVIGPMVNRTVVAYVAARGKALLLRDIELV